MPVVSSMGVQGAGADLSHLLDRRVVCIHGAGLDEVLCQVQHLREVVRGVGDGGLELDAQAVHVCNDGLHVLHAFLNRGQRCLRPSGAEVPGMRTLVALARAVRVRVQHDLPALCWPCQQDTVSV